MTMCEIDLVIAEWCEPKPAHVHTFEESFLRQSPPKSALGFWRCVCIYEHGDIPEWVPVPFSADLNEMSKVLKVVQLRGLEFKFAYDLLDVLFDVWSLDSLTMHNVTAIASASALQCAEALCRMIRDE